MLTNTLKELFLRDLKKLEEEILAYKNDEELWEVKEGITNPGGNLALHLAGNIQHFIGAILGKSGYIRKRDEEFSRKNVKREEIIHEIRQAEAIVDATFSHLKDDELETLYPIHVLGKEMTVGHLLIHMLAHLDYHLGQINYHRRMSGPTTA